MKNTIRWSCFIFISITVSLSSGLQTHESGMEYTNVYEEMGNTTIDPYQYMDSSDDAKNRDMRMSEQNPYNFSNFLNDNTTYDLNLEELLSIIDKLVNEQDIENARSSNGCPAEIKGKLSECSSLCSGILNTIPCLYSELQNFFAACRSGIKQSCTADIVKDHEVCKHDIFDVSKCDGELKDFCPSLCSSEPVECKICGIANTRMARRNQGRTNRKTGRPNRRRPSKQARIIGGMEVSPPRKYPWMVLVLGRAFSRSCAGSIINSRWILTAGQCLEPLNGLAVRVGEHDWKDDNDSAKVYEVQRQVLHPAFEHTGTYGGNTYFFYNDLGLLELKEHIQFDNYIRPVCLPKDDSKDYAGDKGTVSGWGKYGYYQIPRVLKETNIPIDANAKCRGWNETLPYITYTPPITANQICAGPVKTKKGYRDACEFDEGGPLVVKEGDRYVQVGVVSRPSCGDLFSYQQYSSIYSRVSKELDWIKKTTASGTC